MSDDRFERDLRDVILERAPTSLPPDLRARIAGVRDDPSVDGLRRRQRVLPRLAAGLAAALIVVGAGGLLFLSQPRTQPGTAPAIPSSRPSAAPSATPPTPTASPSPTSQPLGSVWTSVPISGDLVGAQLRGIVAYRGGFVAVGMTGQYGRTVAAWTSRDGFAWTRHAIAPDATGPIGALVVGGPGLVAIGGQGDALVAWTSADGVSWSAHTLPGTLPATGGYPRFSVNTDAGPGVIAAGPAGIVVLGGCVPGPTAGASGATPGSTPAQCPANPVLWYSPDGVTWTRESFPEVNVQLITVAAGGPGFIIGGARGTDAAIWTSPDGLSWTQAGPLANGTGTVEDGGLPVNAIGVSPDGIIAVSGRPNVQVQARVWSSHDGKNWFPAADLSRRWVGIGWPTLEGGAIRLVWTSAGWVTPGWTAPDLTPPAYPDPFTIQPRTILRSVDGITWMPLIDPPLPQDHDLVGIADGGDRLVAVGSDESNGLGTPIILVSQGAPATTQSLTLYGRNQSSQIAWFTVQSPGETLADAASGATGFNPKGDSDIGVSCGMQLAPGDRLVWVDRNPKDSGATIERVVYQAPPQIATHTTQVLWVDIAADGTIAQGQGIPSWWSGGAPAGC